MSDGLAERSDLKAIRAMATECARRIGVRDIQVFGTPRGDGSPYVEVGDDYCFIVEERGIEFERRKTDDLDELLYWLCDAAIFSISCDFELKNRKPNEDSRRQLFAKQEALLGQVSDEWRHRKADEHRRVLAHHPFNDTLG